MFVCRYLLCSSMLGSFFFYFVFPLSFPATDSSDLSSWGDQTFSHPASSSVIRHDNRLMMIPAAQSHDRTLSLFMISFCNLSFLSLPFSPPGVTV